MFCLRLARSQRDRQSAADRPHPSIKRQLADGKNVNQMFSLAQISIRAKNAERDWEIKARPFLAHVRGREIDRGFMKREEERAVVDGRADAFARFAHGEIRQSHNDYG